MNFHIIAKSLKTKMSNLEKNFLTKIEEEKKQSHWIWLDENIFSSDID